MKSAGNKHLWLFYAQEAESRGRGDAFGKSTQVENNESGVLGVSKIILFIRNESKTTCRLSEAFLLCDLTHCFCTLAQ